MNSKAIKRQLLAAIAMVLVAALALGSSTYAWFVGNNTVKAEGMKVQAQAESGILIKSVENTSDKFSTVANANMTSAGKLYPTSTVNLSTWWHAVSDTYDNAKADQPANNYAVRADDASDIGSYRVLRKFYIRSADATVGINDKDLAITGVSVTKGAGQQNTEFLDKAIRVGIRVTNEAVTTADETTTIRTGDGYMYVYAPLMDGTNPVTLTPTYAANSSAKSVVAKKAPADAGDRLLLTNHGNTIPANDTSLTVEVYIWYEGEDAQCKSANLPLDANKSVDELNVTVSFKAIDKQAQQTQGG